MLVTSSIALGAHADGLEAADPLTIPSLSPATRAMSLPDAVAYARAHQPAMRAALARVRVREAEARVPSAQWLPIVGVTAQLFGGTSNNTTASYLTPGFMDIPRVGGSAGTATGSFQPYPSTFAGASLTQELFDFGRIAAQSAAADARATMERERAQTALLDVSFNVEEAYFAVFAAKSIVQASDDAYDRSKAHRDLAKAGVDSGMRPPIELTRAEAELTMFDIGRLRAHGALLGAQNVFAATVGVDDPLLDVVDTAPVAADMPSLDEAITRALARDPRLREALASLRAQEKETSAIGAELRPELLGTATLSGRAGGAPPSNNQVPAGDGWAPGVPNWDIGLVFSWPIFDGTVFARKEASRIAEDEKREEIAQVKLEQLSAIRGAYAQVMIASTIIPGLKRAVIAAKANYDQADARFRAGLGTSIELADAEAIRADADVKLVMGQFELARARAAFGRTIAEGL